ncbi:MAG: hypothetical protein HY033_07910 [Ignavibacteriae bacterium]|nr:hypothetical protein [Ignavibacteria bacterium]MBI3364816.1 hypothetical protein [Ignavibacteriota bacterium]
MSHPPARRELDGLVITAELTLISITQGVALYFLIDSSREIIVGMRLAFWPYVITGLLLIFVFWSRTILHTLTIIRWPLEFTHNFMYIASTLVEAIMFTQITRPFYWYLFGDITALMVWLTFLVDLRMIHRLKSEVTDAEGSSFVAGLEREQILNVRVIVPLMIAASAVIVLLQAALPDIFLNSYGHVVLIAVQGFSLAGYLLYTLRFYRRITPQILRYRERAWS